MPLSWRADSANEKMIGQEKAELYPKTPKKSLSWWLCE